MFAEYLKTDEIIFKHALGYRDIYGKEFHTFNEIFLLIENTAKFTSDRITDDIGQNSLVIIPKHQFHQFDHIGREEDYHRYVLQFDSIAGMEKCIETVFDRVKLIHNMSPQSVMQFKKLATLISDAKSQNDKAILLKAITTQILMDLKYNYGDMIITEHMTDEIVQNIVEYINLHFLENISVKSIAQALNFSESLIAHRFKKVMRIPIYRYILQKKLMHAHALVTSGTPATQAAAVCGFCEYSGFYKMYRKYFGFAPSKIGK